MPAAPLKFAEDGTVQWGDMWDSYCILALDGGPPHRGTMLAHAKDVDTESESYQYAVSEIARGIKLVSSLEATRHAPGWLRVECRSAGMAFWVTEAILEENVAACYDGTGFLVPVADTFTLEGEIKNVITAVAKTTHYWTDHVPAEVKQTMAAQARLAAIKQRVVGIFQRRD
jgi:sirohydrochlorin cobaltochelatase